MDKFKDHFFQIIHNVFHIFIPMKKEKTLISYSYAKDLLYYNIGLLINIITLGIFRKWVRQNLFYYSERQIMFNILETKIDNYFLSETSTGITFLYLKPITISNKIIDGVTIKFSLGNKEIKIYHKEKLILTLNKKTFPREKGLYNYIILQYTFQYIKHIINTLKKENAKNRDVKANQQTTTVSPDL